MHAVLESLDRARARVRTMRVADRDRFAVTMAIVLCDLRTKATTPPPPPRLKIRRH